MTIRDRLEGQRHLTFADDDREVLCIVAPVLVTALRDVFDSVEVELRSDPVARDGFRERDRRDREIHVQGPQIELWREAVRTAPIVLRPPSGAIGPDSPVGSGEGATGPKAPGETRL